MSLPAFYLPLCLTFIVPGFHLSCRSTTLLQPFLNTLQFANFPAPGHLDAGVHVEGGGDLRAIQDSRDEKAAFREVHFKLRNLKMGITLTARIWLGLASFDLLVPSHHCRTKPLKHNLSAIVEQTTTFPPTTIRPFLPNFKCRKGPPRLDFLGPPSGYDLPRYPPVAWWGVRFLILQSVLFETP